MTQSAGRHGKHLAEDRSTSRRLPIGHGILVALWVLLVGLGVFLFRLVDWVFLNWGNLRMNELVYTMTADAPYNAYTFPTWYWRGTQEDIIWYSAAAQEDGSFVVYADLSRHGDWGFIKSDGYGGAGEDSTQLGYCLMSLS